MTNHFKSKIVLVTCQRPRHRLPKSNGKKAHNIVNPTGKNNDYTRSL